MLVIILLVVVLIILLLIYIKYMSDTRKIHLEMLNILEKKINPGSSGDTNIRYDLMQVHPKLYNVPDKNEFQPYIFPPDSNYVYYPDSGVFLLPVSKLNMNIPMHRWMYYYYPGFYYQSYDYNWPFNYPPYSPDTSWGYGAPYWFNGNYRHHHHRSHYVDGEQVGLKKYEENYGREQDPMPKKRVITAGPSGCDLNDYTADRTNSFVNSRLNNDSSDRSRRRKLPVEQFKQFY